MLDIPNIKQYLNRNRKPTTPQKPTLKKFLFIGITLLFLLIGVVATYGLSLVNYSDGQRIGIVRKLSHKGLISTGEGELVLTGMRTEQRQSPNSPALTGLTDVWEFSVALFDDATYTKLIAAMDSGQPVILEYKQRYFNGLQITDTSYLITDVKTIGDASQ